jgi:hypothetical protein
MLTEKVAAKYTKGIQSILYIYFVPYFAEQQYVLVIKTQTLYSVQAVESSILSFLYLLAYLKFESQMLSNAFHLFLVSHKVKNKSKKSP